MTKAEGAVPMGGVDGYILVIVSYCRSFPLVATITQYDHGMFLPYFFGADICFSLAFVASTTAPSS